MARLAVFDAAMYVGALLLVLLVSLSMADRVNLLRAGAEAANLALRESKARLGGLVTDRTAALERDRDKEDSSSRPSSVSRQQ